MSYFNTMGRSAGPIQIGSSGTWIYEKFLDLPIDITADTIQYQSTRHLSFSLNKNSSLQEELVLLRARTPLLGEYEKDGQIVSACDLNSVATVGWVKAYAALAPGSGEIDLNDYVTLTTFRELERIVTKNTNNISDLSNRLSSELILINEKFTNVYERIAEEVNTLNDNISDINDSLNEHIDNPFPEGILIRCGGAALL